MTPKRVGLLEVHTAVFLLSFTPLFAKGIDLSPTTMIWGRSFFAALALFLYLKLRQRPLHINSSRGMARLIFLGILLSVHWVTFFMSIQVSSISVGLISFYTYPIITTFLEPYFAKEKIHLTDILSAIGLFVGILMIIPEFSLQNDVVQGILLGLVSSATYSVRNIMSKRDLATHSSSLIMVVQTSVVFVSLIPFVAWERPSISTGEIGLIALLGIIFTALAHTLIVKSMTHLKVFTVSMTQTLMLVYGTVLGIVFFNEIPDARVLIGGSIILLCVLFEMQQHGKR